MDKANITDLLKTGAHQVKFTKMDGSERIGIFTLKDSLMPPQAAPKEGKKKRVPGEDEVIMWDLENNGFRSMRAGSLIDMKSVPWNG